MASPVTIGAAPDGPIPADYNVAAGDEILLTTATATYDGTSASGAYLPALQILGPGGRVAATFVDKDNAIPAGDSVEVTFGTFLRKGSAPCPACHPYDGLLELLDATAWWPLTEASGTVAHDQSGNGHDLGAFNGTPTWEAWTSPVGSPGPLMAEPVNFGQFGAAFTWSPNLSGDFAYNVWVQQHGELGTKEAVLGGQGNPFSLLGGWSFRNRGNLDAPNRFAEVYIGATGVVNGIFSDAALPVDTPYLMGVRYLSGTWTMWVNGVKQAATFAGSYTPLNTQLVICEGRANGGYYSYASMIIGAVSDAGMEALYFPV